MSEEHWDASEYIADYKDCLGLIEWMFPILYSIYDFEKGKTFLELGCGSGKWSALFAFAGMYGTLVDNNPKMLEQVRKNFPAISQSFIFIEDDARTLEKVPVNAFDFVFSEGLLEHFDKDTRRNIIFNIVEKMKQKESCVILLVPHDMEDTYGGEHRWENPNELVKEISETGVFNYIIGITYHDHKGKIPIIGIMGCIGNTDSVESLRKKRNT